MDEIVEDLLGTNNKSTDSRGQNNSYKKPYNKNNNWKEQNQKRNEAYKKIDNMSLKISKDGNMFTQYLNILNRFEKYSVGNCMLILEAEPNAIQIKEKQDWIDRGYEITQPEKSMTILEPNKVNGKIYYNPKEEYDISRTNAPIPEETEYTDRDLLLALFKDCKAEREVVDVLPNGEKGAEYVESENKLYMCRGLKSDYLLKTIIQEFARMEMQDIKNSEMKEFKTYCISYMICKKYGLETSQFDFSNLPNELANKEKGKDIRVELDDIRKNFITVNSKIADYFEQEEKSRKNKEKER